MSSTISPPHNPSATCGALCLAIASVVTLFAGLFYLNSNPIADEGGQHLHAIREFYNGRWTLPDHLPMLPTYHVVATLCWKAFGPHLAVLRGLSAILAVLAIVVFGAIARHEALEHPGDAILHFAWLPILFPFLAMVYTEAMSMLFLVLAVYMHVRRRFLLSAVMLLLACLVRQSNALWVVFMALWAILQIDRAAGFCPRVPSGPEVPRECTRPFSFFRASVGRVWGHVVVLALAASFLIYNRGPSLIMVEANRPRFNAAQFYLFTLFILFLWAPIWVSRLHSEVQCFRQWGMEHRVKAALVVILGMAGVFLLALGYDNPHPWNRNVSYLRNLPLIAMSRYASARFAVASLIIIVAPIIVRFTLAQVNRRLLGLVWLLSLLFLLPHSLAEPRYYIVPMFLLNLFTRFTAGQARSLTVWYLTTSMAIAGYVCLKGHFTGGIW